MNGIQAAKWEMVEAGGRTAQSFGLSRLLGQIYMLLFLSPGAMSLDQIAAQLGISKASASIACRQLESWGAVRRLWMKGDRKSYYAAETNLLRILDGGLLPSLMKKLQSARIQIERSRRLLEEGDGDPEQKQFIRERLDQAESYRSKIEAFLENPIIRRIL